MGRDFNIEIGGDLTYPDGAHFPGGSVIKNPSANAGDAGSIPRRRKWQPTPVFLPGKSHRQKPGGLYSMGLQMSQTRLSDWTTIQPITHINERELAVGAGEWRKKGERQDWARHWVFHVFLVFSLSIFPQLPPHCPHLQFVWTTFTTSSGAVPGETGIKVPRSTEFLVEQQR